MGPEGPLPPGHSFCIFRPSFSLYCSEEEARRELPLALAWAQLSSHPNVRDEILFIFLIANDLETVIYVALNSFIFMFV